jgi:acyl-CoA synthetase (AMP-forming)/AMP-acid ligase II/3-hydroxymyristoyl/3-hydroxydecanoyl-(acyl carrier protein) dehydratase
MPPGQPLDMLQLPYAGCAAELTVAYRDGGAVSNRTFRSRTAAWQRLLAGAPGRKFALFLNDCVDFSCALYGAWLAGKTVYLPGDTLSATCAALSTEVDGFLGDFDSAWRPLTPRAGADSIDDAAAPALAAPLRADFDGLVIYTSGSSGAAQAIPKRLSQLASEVATLEQLFGQRIGHAEVLATVSHQHIYGLLFKVLWPLAAQRPVHARSAAFMEELLPHMQSRPCLLVSSPAHLKRFPATPSSAAQPDTPAGAQLRAVFSSGGPLSAEAADAASVLFGTAPIEIYGSSETGGIAWRCRDASWSAMPGVQWRIDPADAVLEVRSPHLRDDGWLRLADRAAPLSAGGEQRFILQGRTDRIVKLEEKRISLDAIERRLCASPLVTAARVLLHAEAHRRAGVVAFVVPSASGRALLADKGKLALNQLLRTALSDTVEAIAVPRNWRYLEALPLNTQGKTTQADLLALLQPLRSAAPARPVMPDAELRRQDAQQVELALRISAELLYFDGHFDAAPILPGIAQLDWAIAFGRRYFDLPPVFSAVHALKFQQVIQPGACVMLELQHDPSQGSLRFRLHSAAGQHASGRIVFTPSGMARAGGDV